jgi:hypothetical protein
MNIAETESIANEPSPDVERLNTQNHEKYSYKPLRTWSCR